MSRLVFASRSTLRRCFSTASGRGSGELLRVAVVGGGAAGLSSALHLAPLVEAGIVASPIDIFDAPMPKREIGVGIWSSALNPFQRSDRTSHQLAYHEMTSQGTWLGDVGYRTPNGNWLMRSHLPTSLDESIAMKMPALLFLREKDMLTSLEKAVHLEKQIGTIDFHREGNKTRVTGLQEDSTFPWSTKLCFDNDRMSERDYHLIIAADGTHSVLRQRYGGHHRNRTGTLSSPLDLPEESASSWSGSNQLQAVGIQDRNYTVFRGNSPLTSADLGAEGGSTSFQTWGEGHSMRFATVPMFYPGSKQTTEERQVWFVTINDEEISSEPDPLKRQNKILEAFKDWHDPVCRIIGATPPDNILMSRAIAHRHSMGPVIDFNQVVKRTSGKRPPSAGEGPVILFAGDACMTIDPILAQGFTFAMEGAYLLRGAVERICVPGPDDPSLAFDPHLLRKLLRARHEARIERLICLLRVTELVQALGQPIGGTLGGMVNTHLLRPITRLTPNFIKAPIFDAVLKYSLKCPALLKNDNNTQQRSASDKV